jgi:hypothetical protein
MSCVTQQTAASAAAVFETALTELMLTLCFLVGSGLCSYLCCTFGRPRCRVCCVCQQALGLCGCSVFQGVDGLKTQLTDGTSSSCIAAAFPRLCNGLLALAADSQVEQLLLLGYFPWL